MAGGVNSGDTSAFIQLGAIGAPHGVRGWVKVRSDTDPPQGLVEHRQWALQQGGELRTYEIEASGKSGGQIMVKLTGVNDRNAAAALRGAGIFIPRAALPSRDSNEYLRADLVGCEVVNEAERRLGVVRHFVDTLAHAVMVVDGESEIWIPAVPRHVRRVDLAARRIWVNWDDSAA